MARHCIGLNHVAIGIENVGGGKGHALTRKQLAANAALVRDLVARHPTITHLIGHHEYRRMEGHAYWLELDPTYRNLKPDPGPAFMKKLRAEVADLKLEAPPEERSK
jgi:N-acetyl-anhydromuramyl-L-alanine amidase AmpD